MRRLLGITLAILSLLPATVKAQIAAQEVQTLSLQQAMDYAVKHNATAKNARLDIALQKAKNAEITGIALPQIGADGQFTDFLNPQKTFVPGEFAGQPAGTFIPLQFTPTYGATANGTVSQILFDGSVLVALQARKEIVKLYQQNATMTEENVRYNVQKAYYSFVIAKRQYNILVNSLAFGRKIGNDLNALYKEGFAEKIEVDRTQVQINNLTTDSIRIGAMIEVSEQLLKYQMGMDMSRPIVLTDTSVNEKVMEAASMLLNNDIDYTDRTEYNLLQTQLQLNKFDLKRHRLSGLPSLAAFGSATYTYSSNTFKDLVTKDYLFYSLVGLKLNVKIFDGLQRYNRVKQAKISIAKTQNSIDDTKLGIDFQIAQSRTTLKNALLSIDNQERNLTLANGVLDLAQRKYKEGVGSNTEVTQAQTDQLRAQNNYFSTMLEVINAKSDLQKAYGQFK